MLVSGFALLWVLCTAVRNYGFVDAGWAYSIGLLALLYALLGTGHLSRRLIFSGICVIWSIRLGTHILQRVIRDHPKEDARYLSLRKEWPHPFLFFLFFEVQALSAIVLSLPFFFTAFDRRPEISFLEITGYLLALTGIVGEAISDRQKKTFASDPSNKGQVCNTGLWRYSRHPNYFFESIVWWGFFFAAATSPWGWATVICPLLMLWLLLRVTGIPLTEKLSLQKRGDAYRAYQQTTSAFIPWFRKKQS